MFSMFPSATMSNSTSMSEEASVSSETRAHDYNSLSSLFAPRSPDQHHQQEQPLRRTKKKRSQPGNPDPDAEVVALSPKTLMATNRFVCEICSKGFQRDQNLQLHRRGHNLPWKLRQRSSKEAVRKRVYVCPESTCVHHHPSRALGDLTGIKKHFCRKHGEKKWKCEKCSKKYAVQSDWKAHVKTCGTREYRCGCGTLFSRKDSFITHRAFCDALAEESARLIASTTNPQLHPLFLPFSSWNPLPNPNSDPLPNPNPSPFQSKPQDFPSLHHPYLHLPTTTTTSPHLSATALLQKASTIGHITTISGDSHGGGYSATLGHMGSSVLGVGNQSTWQKGNRLTRDFLGAAAGEAGISLPGRGLDMIAASAGHDCAGGDSTNPHRASFAGLPPVTKTWGNC